MESESGEGTNCRNSLSLFQENGITIKEAGNKKAPGKHNPKLSVFREFVLATVHHHAEEHAARQSSLACTENGTRQFFACDLIAQSGIAGLQWKQHLGDKVHVTVVEQRESQTLQENIHNNGFTVSALPLDPMRPAGMFLPEQSSSELHLAQCDPLMLMQLESFDFLYVDPHKNPAPYFSSVFRNVRNNGVMCFVVPDTMHFARSPHVVQRCYGARCMKTEYLKELAVRIILAALAVEAGKCNKALTVLYAISLEDFLLIAVRVVRGPKLADDMLQQNISHVLHCRICEERALYPATMAPVEDPYSLISCDCKKHVPGKTGVILGPVWKGSIYDCFCLTRLAASGKALKLTTPFFTLLQRVMKDCLCNTPPSLSTGQQGPAHRTPQIPHSSDRDVPQMPTSDAQDCACNSPKENGGDACGSEKEQNVHHDSIIAGGDCTATSDAEEKNGDSLSSSENLDASVQSNDSPSVSRDSLKHMPTADTSAGESRGVKRSAADTEGLALLHKRPKVTIEPTPCFFYNMHSKRLGTHNLPKHQAVVERLRAHGYRCCRTHFEKYAIRTDADLKSLATVLGTGESKTLYVKGSQQTG